VATFFFFFQRKKQECAPRDGRRGNSMSRRSAASARHPPPGAQPHSHEPRPRRTPTCTHTPTRASDVTRDIKSTHAYTASQFRISPPLASQAKTTRHRALGIHFWTGAAHRTDAASARDDRAHGRAGDSTGRPPKRAEELQQLGRRRALSSVLAAPRPPRQGGGEGRSALHLVTHGGACP